MDQDNLTDGMQSWAEGFREIFVSLAAAQLESAAEREPQWKKLARVFGRYVRAARHSYGMTLEGLVEASGVGCDTIVSIENGMLSLR